MAVFESVAVSPARCAKAEAALAEVLDDCLVGDPYQDKGDPCGTAIPGFHLRVAFAASFSAATHRSSAFWDLAARRALAVTLPTIHG